MTETKYTSPPIKPDTFNNGKDGIIATIKKSYVRMKENANKFMVDNRMYEKMDQVVKYLMSHPVLLTICIIILATLIIPVLLFIIFIVINVAFAFTGFIVVVAAVLTMEATILCTLLFTIIMTIAMIGACLMFTWLLSCYMMSIMRNFKITPSN